MLIFEMVIQKTSEKNDKKIESSTKQRKFVEVYNEILCKRGREIGKFNIKCILVK